MANPYHVDANASQIGQALDADAGRDPWPGGYVTPNGPAPVVLRNKHGLRYLAPRIWGVPPPQSFSSGVTDMANYRPVTTVRNTESPFWIGNLRHTQFRCLVPVTSFIIWSERPDPRTNRKTQHRFHLPAEPVFAFAGLCRDSEVPSFAYLTVEPNDFIAAISPKVMPVILAPEDHETWLSADWKVAQGLVRAYPSSMMEKRD